MTRLTMTKTRSRTAKAATSTSTLDESEETPYVPTTPQRSRRQRRPPPPTIIPLPQLIEVLPTRSVAPPSVVVNEVTHQTRATRRGTQVRRTVLKSIPGPRKEIPAGDLPGPTITSSDPAIIYDAILMERLAPKIKNASAISLLSVI